MLPHHFNACFHRSKGQTARSEKAALTVSVPAPPSHQSPAGHWPLDESWVPSPGPRAAAEQAAVVQRLGRGVRVMGLGPAGTGPGRPEESENLWRWCFVVCRAHDEGRADARA